MQLAVAGKQTPKKITIISSGNHKMNAQVGRRALLYLLDIFRNALSSLSLAVKVAVRCNLRCHDPSTEARIMCVWNGAKSVNVRKRQIKDDTTPVLVSHSCVDGHAMLGITQIYTKPPGAFVTHRNVLGIRKHAWGQNSSQAPVYNI